MEKRPALRRHFMVYAIILLIGLVSSLFFTWYLQHDFYPEKKVSHVEKIIREKDKEIKHEIKFLQQVYQSNPDSIFSLLNRYKHVYYQKGYLFRIVKNDSTVFWSDNKVPFQNSGSAENQPLYYSGNGWFRRLTFEEKNTTFAGYYLIKRDYNYQNDYLQNTFHRSFNLDQTVSFYPDSSGEFPITDESGNFLFSVSFNKDNLLTNSELNILFVLYLITLIFIIALIYELHHAIYRITKKYKLFIFGFVGDLLIIRFLLFYFRIPEVLYKSKLFSPFYYAYSDLIPSIADLFLNALFLVIIGFFLFYHLKFKYRSRSRNSIQKILIVSALLVLAFFLFGVVDFTFRSLIIDSSISFDLNNFFSISWMSVFGFTIISAVTLAYIIITSKLAFLSYQYCKKPVLYLSLSFFASVIYSGYSLIWGDFDIYKSVFILIYILSFGFYFAQKEYKFSLGNIVFYVLLFSVLSTYLLHIYNDFKEKENRKLLAVELASEQRDPLAEYMFQREQSKVYRDTILNSYINQYGEVGFNYDTFNEYFISKYFKGYWKKYECQVTICGENDLLMVQPDDMEVDCFSFFDEKINTDGQPTESDGLYFLRYGPAENGYLGVFDFSDSIRQNYDLKVFVELFPKTSESDLGFPDLLINKDIDQMPDLTSYSYAKYQDGELYKRVGDYFYNFNISHYQHTDGQFVFFNQNGYNHLFYKIDENKSLIISRKQKSLLDLLAPFSYLFLFYFIFFGLVFFIFVFPFTRKTTSLSFRTRMQISISSVILFSFFVIGFFTLIYINNLNNQKNSNILSEKTHSILVEMQHKFSDIDTFDQNTSGMISEQLAKFSSVFFTDINLFDVNGKLISSSRPQIYEEHLISRYINPEAYKALSIDNSSLFIHEEHIGKQEYLSAYIPFVNSMGDVIAYLNLPYFAKENDLNKEISAFLVAYINIYVILIAISVLIAIVISNYISRPVKMIITRIRQVKLGGRNETINWKRRDEIGQLVVEYNRMIDELARSAELLARSERETAWREMARQIAHEIKNPLTPMKLSVQYLERAWQNKSPDWEKRLEKFTKTMIEQIDSLSIIASEFSDFAKMPVAKKENTDLVEIIKSSMSLFKNYDQINFEFDYETGRSYEVFADKEQLLRAFNNLLKNSIQAIGNNQDGNIHISIQRKFNEIMVEISDNGGGIPEDISGKIFSPNFTTKSGGMGLGLAIVKKVIENSGGEIHYESEKGQGTTFIIRLPAL